MTNRYLWWLFIFLALIAYSLVWADTPTQGMSLNAYDLAEWVSLHPSTHPVRLPSLFVRLQLTIVCWMIAFAFQKQSTIHSWLSVLAIIVLSIAQLPPFEFFLSARDDLNYTQQFILSSVSLLAIIFSRWKRLLSYQTLLLSLLLIIGIVTTFIGVSESLRLLASVQQPATCGLGAPLLITLYIHSLIGLNRHLLKRDAYA